MCKNSCSSISCRSVNIEFDKKFTLEKIKNVLEHCMKDVKLLMKEKMEDI